MRKGKQSATQCPLRVKLRRTQCEQMSSGLPLKADIALCSRHVLKMPKPDMTPNLPKFSESVQMALNQLGLIHQTRGRNGVSARSAG